LNTKHIHLLSQVAVCARCGQRLTGVRDHGICAYRHRRTKGLCGERWTACDTLEQSALELLVTLIDNPATAAALNHLAAEMSQMAGTHPVLRPGQSPQRLRLARRPTQKAVINRLFRQVRVGRGKLLGYELTRPGLPRP
jgi:hypothetical protein